MYVLKGRFHKSLETGRECIWGIQMVVLYWTIERSDKCLWSEYRTSSYFKFASAWISGEIRIPVGANTFRFNNRVYWFSWSDPANAQKSWSEAEKQCRTQCMELVSLDSPGETEFVAAMIPRGKFREFEFSDLNNFCNLLKALLLETSENWNFTCSVFKWHSICWP